MKSGRLGEQLMGSEKQHGKIASLLYAQSTLRQVRDVMQQQGFESAVYFVEMAYVVVSDQLRATTGDQNGNDNRPDRLPPSLTDGAK
jgi:hypothetical protein